MQTPIKSTWLGLLLLTSGIPSLHSQSDGARLVSAAVASGGGASTQRVYAVHGTLGQSAVGTAVAGPYHLEGGFWHRLAVLQTAGLPVLRLTVDGAKAVVSWPVQAQGFVLEETTNPESGLWTPTAGTMVDTATEHTFTLRPTGTLRLFRLRKANP